MINDLLKILRRISEIIARLDDHSEVLTAVVKELAMSLDCEVCSIYIYQESEDALVLGATYGLNRDCVGRLKLKPGEGLTGDSFKTRRILNLANPDQDSRFVFFKDSGEERYKSFLSMPLTVGGSCVGMLTIQSVKPRTFTHPVVDMVKSLSAQLANLILNAKMVSELTRDQKAPSQSDKQATITNGQIMLKGVAANAGVALGKALIFESKDYFEEIVHATHSDTEQELALFDQAVETTKVKTLELEQRALTMISEFDASIFNVHLLFLEDQSLMAEIKNEITDNGHSVDFSIKLIYQEYKKRFKMLGAQVFREKVMDFKDVMLRLLETIRALRDGEKSEDLIKVGSRGLVLIAKELLPSDLIRMPIDSISGIVCEKGGVTAHVAILAKALDIPALMGVRNLITQIKGNDEILLDCHAETLHIRPNEQFKEHFEEILRAGIESEGDYDNSPVLTQDSEEIIIRANISLISETALLSQYGARGVGLYRTEFLFMIRDYLPSEDDQFRIYSKILREADGDGVTIRVLDVGGDKPIPYLDFPEEDNPALGQRGIRLLLARRDIFKTQMRAILRAGVLGKLNILFPMITNVHEVYLIREVISEVESELHAENIEHSENYQIGIMLEVPSAVFELEEFIKEADFISIGSNDLLQYTFAADRSNELVADIHQALSPVFLKIIRRIGKAFKAHPSKRLTICGEMGSNALALPFLFGAGIKELSMAPAKIPVIKKVARSFSLHECEGLLETAVGFRDAQSVNDMIKKVFQDKGLNSIAEKHKTRVMNDA